MIYYQWEKLVGSSPEKNLKNWKSKFGALVISRTPWKVRFSVLIDNPSTEVYLVGNFNNWGLTKSESDKLIHDDKNEFATIITNKIKHKDSYKFLVRQFGRELYMQDPAGYYFDDNGNTIFWDFKTGYKMKNPFVKTNNRTTKIVQTDLPGLIMHYADKNGICGRDIPEKKYYKFIAKSGVLEEVKRLGFNTIQFLPFAQSIDGNNWKYRYLIPFQFAIQKNWGNPDEFKEMIDACHELEIAIIGDFVLGHMPHKDYKIFGHDCKDNGIHLWESKNKTKLYMRGETHWGTMRPNHDDELVREFYISSVLHFMKEYRIDGFRIDNVDGIIREGKNGDGVEKKNGRTFLRNLNSAIYSYNPSALVHFEAHYFYKDNAKLLVIPLEEDPKALGATAYNSSRLTYFFHSEFMIKDVKEITPWIIKNINDEKEWGRSNSTVADFHNHDAAAGLMEQRATGSYAYDAMTCKFPENHFHALGKIKVMEAIISFATEGRILDLVQTFLLQKGTFEHDPTIHWHLTFNQSSRNCLYYKQKINEILDEDAFWPENVKNRKFLNVDDKNKVLVVERKGTEKYVIIINLGSWNHTNYKVGVSSRNNYELVLNSDLFEYAGSGRVSYPLEFLNRESKNFEFLDREIELGFLPGYGIVILKEKQKK